MALYYINLKPHTHYFTVIVGEGGFISKEFTAEHDWILYDGRRKFMVMKGHLFELIDFLFKQDPYDCIIKYRDDKPDEWVKFKKKGLARICKEIEERCKKEYEENLEKAKLAKENQKEKKELLKTKEE